MKINPIITPSVLGNYQSPKSVANKVQSVSGSDQVSFSEEALNFSKALAEAREMIETRTPAEQSHIANLTNAVRDGSYKVSSDDVAAKILESVKGDR